MNRTLFDSHVEGSTDAYKTQTDHLRVNVYGASGITDNELQAVYDGAFNMLGDLTGSNDPLGGFELSAYETDVTLSQDISNSQNDLIDDGYAAIDGSDYDDEHAVVLWAYWDHESDSSDCGPNGDPCPDVFMMGHDIDRDAVYPAARRQPYVYIEPSNVELYDIQQGFVYVNEFERDPVESRLPAAHELGHALVERDAYQSEDLAPETLNQNADHYLGTRRFDGEFGVSYNTVMATASNPDATKNGDCSSFTSSDGERIESSDCTRIAVSETVSYYGNNV